MERKSPLPAFTKCVKNNVLPLREDRNLGFRGGVKNKPINSSTIHPLNITSPSPAFGTLPRGVVVEPFTPHASRFTSRKAVIRIIRDVGKAWFSDTLRAGFAIAHTASSRKSAFTLAEVLITLGIIGVVAAMTLPTVMQNYRNHVVETRLAKFYTIINQAIRLAEADYGDKSYWFEENAGNSTASGDVNEKYEWFKKYFYPYMKIIKYKQLKGATSGVYVYYLPDGSAFASVNGGQVNRDWLFWPGNPDKCPYDDSSTGVCRFWFFYSPGNEYEGTSFYKNKGVEPWRTTANPDDFLENCKTSTHRYDCTALIHANGWKIPKDYPFKVRY